MKHIYMLLILLFVKGLQSCITPFTPDGIGTSRGTLVVEGDILANDTTTVFLSYSIALHDENNFFYETNAEVWVESETGIKYVGELRLPNGKAPYFAINTTTLDPAVKYKLCVRTRGKNYASDLMPVLVAPPIESVNYIVNDTRTEVTFYVNAHGDDTDSRYYKWRYQEDWEFTSRYYTNYYYNVVADTIIPLPDGINTFYCWGNSQSPDILIAQTDGLDENIVHRMKLVSFNGTDRRANYLYSLTVHQLSISQEAYRYWSTLKKNSEEIGGIFAPQPAENTGNIHCLSEPNEKVLGYISASQVASKRIFVSADDLQIYRNSDSCALFEPDDSGWPTNRSLHNMGYRVAWDGALWNVILWIPARCVDCRFVGTKNKPSFWPNNHQ